MRVRRGGLRQRAIPAATVARRVGFALIALAFLIQNYVAERHFHSLSGLAANAVAQADLLAKPFAPASDQQDDDCPLCQALGLGNSFDVPSTAVLAGTAPSSGPLVVAPHHAVPLESFIAGHRPRGPPALFSII